MTAECQERLHPIFHNKPYAAIRMNDLNDLAACNQAEHALLGRTQDLVGRHSRRAGRLPRKEAPRLADRGAHPFWPGDRAQHGTGPPLVPSSKMEPNCKFLCYPKKRSGIEINSGAWGASVERGTGVLATPIAGHPEYPRFLGLATTPDLILEVGV